MGSDSSLSTTLPLPSVEGPPTNSIRRAAHVPADSAAPIMLAATCAVLHTAQWVDPKCIMSIREHPLIPCI